MTHPADYLDNAEHLIAQELQEWVRAQPTVPSWNQVWRHLFTIAPTLDFKRREAIVEVVLGGIL